MARKQQRERRLRRRSVRAWINAPAVDRDIVCDVVDVSANGAKLSTDWADKIPETFRLRRVPKSPSAQDCKVIWRRGGMIGVRYIDA